MPVRHSCPQCGRAMLLETVHEGHDVPCPACGHVFRVAPGTVSGVPPAPPAPPAPRAASVPDPRPHGDDGTGALVVGIVAVVLCGLLGPVAWYMGHRVREDARRSGREPPGSATAGWILGIVATALLALSAVVGLFLLFAVGAASGF